MMVPDPTGPYKEVDHGPEGKVGSLVQKTGQSDEETGFMLGVASGKAKRKDKS